MILAIIIVLCSTTVYFHTHFLWVTAEISHRLRHFPPRSIILFIVLMSLLAHIAEILFWAVGFYVTYYWFGLGGFEGNVPDTFREFFYYSSATYTSLGMGDITPTPDFEILTGLEALVGLMMITWSASFTYLSMRKFWPEHY